MLLIYRCTLQDPGRIYGYSPDRFCFQTVVRNNSIQRTKQIEWAVCIQTVTRHSKLSGIHADPYIIAPVLPSPYLYHTPVELFITCAFGCISLTTMVAAFAKIVETPFSHFCHHLISGIWLLDNPKIQFAVISRITHCQLLGMHCGQL